MWRAGVTAGLALGTCFPGPAAGSPEFPRNNSIWHKISATSEFPTYFILQWILVTSMSLPLFLLAQSLQHRAHEMCLPSPKAGLPLFFSHMHTDCLACALGTNILIPRGQIKHRFRNDLSDTNSITTNVVVSKWKVHSLHGYPGSERDWAMFLRCALEQAGDFWLKGGFRRLRTHCFSLVPTEHVWDVEACGILGYCSSGSVCVTQHATARYRVLLHEVMADLGQTRGQIPRGYHPHLWAEHTVPEPPPTHVSHLLCLSHSDWKGLWELLAPNLLPCVRTWVPCN